MPMYGMRDQKRERRSRDGDVVWLVMVLVQGAVEWELDGACDDGFEGEVGLGGGGWWEGGFGHGGIGWLGDVSDSWR